jgi:ribonuclease VapC
VVALDTSAIIAILLEEPEEEVFSRIVAFRGAVVGAPSLVEVRMVLERYLPNDADREFRRMLRQRDITIIPFDAAMFEVASDAFARFGKGRGHPAKLNFGDCMAYATARVRAVPLLFKGNDFVHTDIEPAYRPVP